MSTSPPSQRILQLGYLCCSPGTEPFVPNGLKRTFPFSPPSFHFIFALQFPFAHSIPQSPSPQHNA